MENDGVYVRVERGPWVPPRWLGAEPRATLLGVFLPLIGIVSQSVMFFTVTLIVGVILVIYFGRLYRDDPKRFTAMIFYRSMQGVTFLTRVPHRTSRVMRRKGRKVSA